MSITVADMVEYARKRKLRDTHVGTTAVYRDLNGLGPAAPEHAIGVVPGYKFEDGGAWELRSTNTADHRTGQLIGDGSGLRAQVGTHPEIPLETHKVRASDIPSLQQTGISIEKKDDYPPSTRIEMRARYLGEAPTDDTEAILTRPYKDARAVLQQTSPQVQLFRQSARSVSEATWTLNTSRSGLVMADDNIDLAYYGNIDDEAKYTNTPSNSQSATGGINIDGGKDYAKDGTLTLTGLLPKDAMFRGTAFVPCVYSFSGLSGMIGGSSVDVAQDLTQYGAGTWRAMATARTTDGTTAKVMHLLSFYMCAYSSTSVTFRSVWSTSPALLIGSNTYNLQWYVDVLFIKID